MTCAGWVLLAVTFGLVGALVSAPAGVAGLVTMASASIAKGVTVWPR